RRNDRGRKLDRIRHRRGSEDASDAHRTYYAKPEVSQLLSHKASPLSQGPVSSAYFRRPFCGVGHLLPAALPTRSPDTFLLGSDSLLDLSLSQMRNSRKD